jgi:hypothetical protein
MFCCLPIYSSAETNAPLLLNQETDSVESLLKRLDLMIRAKRAQAEQYRIDGVENRLRMNQCVSNGDKTGATHYCIEARKSDHYYAQDLKQSSNILEASRKIRDAIVNLEVGKNLSASNLTMEQLQKEMSVEKLKTIMDTFRDRVFDVNQQSEQLSQTFDLSQEDVNAEVEQLFERQLYLPSIPNQNLNQNSNRDLNQIEKRLILKTE